MPIVCPLGLLFVLDSKSTATIITLSAADLPVVVVVLVVVVLGFHGAFHSLNSNGLLHKSTEQHWKSLSSSTNVKFFLCILVLTTSGGVHERDVGSRQPLKYV